MQHIVTESGTAYDIDDEQMLICRRSDRELKWISGDKPSNRVLEAWRPYTSLTFVDRFLDGGRCLYVIYADGSFSLSTNIQSYVDDEGNEL